MSRRISYFSQFGSWMRRRSVVVFALLMCGLTAIVLLMSNALLELSGLPNIEWFKEPSIEHKGIAIVLSALIVAPLLETLLFQFLPCKVLWLFVFFRKHRWLVVVLSGILFGSQHFYNLHYIFLTTIMGCFMMWGYIIRYRRSPFWSVALYHFLWNGTVLALEYLGVGLE